MPDLSLVDLNGHTVGLKQEAQVRTTGAAQQTLQQHNLLLNSFFVIIQNVNGYGWVKAALICARSDSRNQTMPLSACCVIFLNEISFISFRYCYFMLVDIARVFLKSSDPDKNYINASFVDVSNKTFRFFLLFLRNKLRLPVE